MHVCVCIHIEFVCMYTYTNHIHTFIHTYTGPGYVHISHEELANAQPHVCMYKYTDHILTYIFMYAYTNHIHTCTGPGRVHIGHEKLTNSQPHSSRFTYML
jgi:hypothetical protein